MTKNKQERIAKNAIGIFLDAWCTVDNRDEDSEDSHCHVCEFATDDGKCLAKIFANTSHNPERCEPQLVATRRI